MPEMRKNRLSNSNRKTQPQHPTPNRNTNQDTKLQTQNRQNQQIHILRIQRQRNKPTFKQNADNPSFLLIKLIRNYYHTKTKNLAERQAHACRPRSAPSRSTATALNQHNHTIPTQP